MSGIRIAEILDRLAARGIAADLIGGASDVAIGDVFHDDRDVRAGGLFCCVVGADVDGHDLAARAVDQGAVALLSERTLDVDIPQVVVANVREAMPHVAAIVHGDPSASLCCVGITGTNGKTTTAALTAAILREAGRQVAVLGTLTGVRTTPEATELQRELERLRNTGVDTVVMEVSSHALAQHRVDGMAFDVAVFTNLSRDHLDFHGTMEEYFRAKARLFEPDLAARAVVGIDDSYGRLLRDASSIPVEDFGLDDARPIANVAPIEFTWAGGPVTMELTGSFNIANALAAATTARVLGVDDATIRAGLSRASQVPGRFEAISMGQDFTVVVDFAHTPDGLTKVLDVARDLAGDNRVLVVFGAGGDRDRTKRPLMGEAARRADFVVVTNDNPRTEAPESIASEILAGIDPTEGVRVELDRRRAIATAIEAANSGDVVIIAGKGHETTQTIGTVAEHFDDREVAREMLAQIGWAS